MEILSVGNVLGAVAQFSALDLILMAVLLYVGVWMLGQFIRMIANVAKGKRPFATV
jgi:hypothetical protein